MSKPMRPGIDSNLKWLRGRCRELEVKVERLTDLLQKLKADADQAANPAARQYLYAEICEALDAAETEGER